MTLPTSCVHICCLIFHVRHHFARLLSPPTFSGMISQHNKKEILLLEQTFYRLFGSVFNKYFIETNFSFLSYSSKIKFNVSSTTKSLTLNMRIYGFFFNLLSTKPSLRGKVYSSTKIIT